MVLVLEEILKDRAEAHFLVAVLLKFQQVAVRVLIQALDELIGRFFPIIVHVHLAVEVVGVSLSLVLHNFIEHWILSNSSFKLLG